MSAERPGPRVAFFGHAQGRRGDGLSTYSRELVGALRRQGADVRFFAHRPDGDVLPVAHDHAHLLDAWHFKTVTLAKPGSMRTISAALEEFGPDMVHISWSFSLQDGAIAAAAHRVGAPCVATFHLPHGPDATARGQVLRGLYSYHRRQMSDVDRCIVLSDAQRDLLVRAGYPGSRTVVIPNGVDTDAIAPGPSRLREDLAARLVVLYMGRLDPEKRVPALVESFVSLGLPEDHVLCIAGDGVQRERVRRLAARHANVRILGLVDSERALGLLRGCDIFVLPSTTEGLALSLLEAMAAERAIIATDAGEDGRALQDAGMVVPVHPLRPALDEALRTLVADAALRARLGRAARHRAVTRYSMASNVQAVLEVYATASAEGHRPGHTATCGATLLP